MIRRRAAVDVMHHCANLIQRQAAAAVGDAEGDHARRIGHAARTHAAHHVVAVHVQVDRLPGGRIVQTGIRTRGADAQRVGRARRAVRATRAGEQAGEARRACVGREYRLVHRQRRRGYRVAADARAVVVEGHIERTCCRTAIAISHGIGEADFRCAGLVAARRVQHVIEQGHRESARSRVHLHRKKVYADARTVCNRRGQRAATPTVGHGFSAHRAGARTQTCATVRHGCH